VGRNAYSGITPYFRSLMMRTVTVTRYVTPLREGGSLPAIAEASDEEMYVLKFRGAGQGVKALIAEVIGGEVARLLGFRVPELVFAQLNEGFGRTEADEEIQDLLKASTGLNLAMHFLSGAISFDPAVGTVDPWMASGIVWLDAFLTNMDRTAKNTNMLVWKKDLWLIDHGASLYFHHTWRDWEKQALNPFPLIKDHVLLPWASELDEVDSYLSGMVTRKTIEEITDLIPNDWLESSGELAPAGEQRLTYHQFLETRAANSQDFVREATNARNLLV